MADRKQVNLNNLDPVDPTPSMRAVGGTNSAVAPGVLKDNNYLRLSRALAQSGNLIGQASNINQQLGKEAAEKLTADEINDIIEGRVPSPTGGTLGKLGFQKAFHQISAKRYADTTAIQEYADAETRINLKLDEMVQSSTPIEAAMSYVDEELQGVQEKIGKYFENNVHGQRVINMITGELGSRIRTGSAGGYVKRQKAYLDSVAIEGERNGVLKVFSGEVGPVAYLQGVDKKLKALGKNPLERNVITRSIVVDATEMLIDRGRYTDAAHYLSQWQKAKVGGKPINQTLEMEKTIASLSSKIATAKKKAEDEGDGNISYPEQKIVYVGSVLKLLNAGKLFDVYSPRHDEEGKDQSDEYIKTIENEVDNVLYRLQTNYPEETLGKWKNNLISELVDKKKSGTYLNRTILAALNNLSKGRDLKGEELDGIQMSEKASNILDGTQKTINEALDVLASRTASQLRGQYNDTQKLALETQASTYFEENNTKRPIDFLTEYGDPKNPQGVWRGLQNVWNEAHKIDWIYEKTSPFESRETAVQDQIGRGINQEDYMKARGSSKKLFEVKDEIRNKAGEVKEMLTRELIEEARVLSEVPGLTQKEKESRLRIIRDKIIQEENEELQYYLTAKAKNIKTKSKKSFDLIYPDFFNEGKGKGEDWLNAVDNKKSAKYPTLSRPEFLEKAFDYREALENEDADAGAIEIPWSEVGTDIKEARKTASGTMIRSVLLFYGYPEFDGANVVADLNKAQLGFDAVRLVRTPEQLDDIVARFTRVAQYYDEDNEYVGSEILKKKKGMTKKEIEERKRLIKDVKIMTGLGIWGMEGVSHFYEVQSMILPPRVNQ